MARDLPNPPESGLVNALRFGDDTFRFIEAMQARFDDAAAVPIPGRAPLVVVTNPELVGDALSRPAEFRRVPASGPAALIATQGLVQSEGDLWEQQRGIMGPAFMGPQVRAYANTVGRRVETLVEEWSTTIGDGESITRNLHGEMTALTVRVASEILLGEDIGLERAEQFHSWMQTAGDEFEFGLDAVTPEWVPTRTDPEFKAAAEGILGLAEELIERRRADLAERDPDDEERPKDMLTMLLLAEDKPDVEYPDNQIRDEVSTFLIAGHETTALSLTYTQCLLSQHPEIREQVRQEANEVIGDETPSYDHVSDLEYTGRVFQEALRLYPAAWAVFRQASADVRLGEYRVPEGAAIIMPQWSIHRDPRYFENPEQFDPDRWLDRSPQEVEAYFPFSSGPHACIGRQFSITGARLALATIVQSFDVDVADDALDDLRATPTLRPGGSVDATIRSVDE
ncbi:cytochrome P450 [Halorubrum lacusprofundi]|uniref:cytochrome P450 n=1 Tax=Halorubrum lacusprofundi TaxID=2247 RepID=UPI001481D85E|nr:cytochrome P450 [Halorubrum lacusprofundi]MCG1008213.1 cytochrome P450 [Halorubrum lacusprofundi]